MYSRASLYRTACDRPISFVITGARYNKIIFFLSLIVFRQIQSSRSVRIRQQPRGNRLRISAGKGNRDHINYTSHFKRVDGSRNCHQLFLTLILMIV